MEYQVGKITGLNSDQQAALTFHQAQGEELFLAILRLSCDDAFTRGRQFLSELSDFYFAEEGATSERLTKAFTKAREQLSDTEEFDLVLGSFTGKVLYLIASGKVTVSLIRDDRVNSLIQTDSFGKLISGFLQEGDRVLLATDSYQAFVGSSAEEFKKSLELPISEWEEEASNKIAAAQVENHGLSALLLEILLSEESQIPPTTTQSSLSERPDIEEDKSVSLPQRPKINPSALGRVIPKSGRVRLILAAILLLIILAGVGWQFYKKSTAEKDAQFNQYLSAAGEDFKSAEDLQTINPGEAKNKLENSLKEVDQALSVKANDAAALDLKNKINQERDSILQQFKATELPVFLDLDLIKKGLTGQNISLSDGKILLLDPSSETLVTIDVAKKSQQTQAGKETLGDAKLASLNGQMAFVYSSDKGVVKVDITNQKASTVAKKDSDLGSVVDLAGFASNVYLLDGAKNQIWKYLPTSSGYSDKREYLSSGVKADFSGARRMQIESSIYVMKSGGEMLRFTKGASDFFSIGGLDKGIKDPKSFFTSSEVDNVYILDSGNSRLVVVDKKGAYKAQYSGDKFGSATDLVVDEKGKKVYLLEGSKIYSMDLK